MTLTLKRQTPAASRPPAFNPDTLLSSQLPYTPKLWACQHTSTWMDRPEELERKGLFELAAWAHSPRLGFRRRYAEDTHVKEYVRAFTADEPATAPLALKVYLCGTDGVSRRGHRLPRRITSTGR